MGKLSDAVRVAIKGSGVSRYALAKQVGVAESVLSRFMNEKQSITLDTLEKLSEVLNLKIVCDDAQGKARFGGASARQGKAGSGMVEF